MNQERDNAVGAGGLQRLPSLGVGVTALALAVYSRQPALALALGAALSIGLSLQVPAREAAARYLLQGAIVLLGFTLPLDRIWSITRDFAPLVMGHVGLTLLAGFFLGRMIAGGGVRTALLSSGTAVCGGTTIATLGSVIDAPPRDVAVCLTVVFVMNGVALITLPWVGELAGLSGREFGLWVALAVHDTSSVVGAAATFGEEALETATTVKLARALWLIPLVLMASLLIGRGRETKLRLPPFVLLFVVASGLASLLEPAADVAHRVKSVSQLLLVAALFFIGAQMTRDVVRDLGGRTVAMAVALWFLVLPVTFIAARYFG